MKWLDIYQTHSTTLHPEIVQTQEYSINKENVTEDMTSSRVKGDYCKDKLISMYTLESAVNHLLGVQINDFIPLQICRCCVILFCKHGRQIFESNFVAWKGEPDLVTKTILVFSLL